MNDLRKAYRTAAIIGLAMIASIFVYAIIVEMVKSGTIPLTGTPLPTDELNIIKFVLLGITAVNFVLIRVIVNQILSSGAPSNSVRDAQARGFGAAPDEHQRLVTSAVVSYAMSEAPAIFGLVVFFLGRDSGDFYLFMLLSLFLFSVYFPKYSKWEEWVKTRQRRSP